jgi:replicative DNA helicase
MSVDNDVSFKSFGRSFQEKIIQALLSDREWSQQMLEVIKPSYFDVSYLKYLFELYQKHYEQYKTFPSLTLLVTMVRDAFYDIDKAMATQITNFLHTLKNNPDMNDLPYVKDRSLNFCKNQALKEALEHAVDLTREEKYEEIVERIKEAITVGTPNTTGHDFFEDFEARFQKEERNVVATGVKALDARDIMNGGLGKGELGLIMAASGVGKSHVLVALGANAIRAGKNVLHYTFELRENAVGIRYDANFTGVSATDVPDERELIVEKYRSLDGMGRLIIKEYPTNTATVMMLRSHIEKLAITKAFIPDVVIIDYADIMRSSRQFDSLRHELKLVYEELRGLAMELGIPIWTASQSNRDSSDNEVVGLDKISESFGKVMVCDFIMTLARKPLQKATGMGNLFVAKNRMGKDGIVFPVKIDTARSIIDILDNDINFDEYTKMTENSSMQLMKSAYESVKKDRELSMSPATSLRAVSNGE